MVVIMFLLATLENWRGTGSFIYCAEVLMNKHTSAIGTVMHIIDTFTMVIISVYFLVISKDWQPFYIGFFCLLVIATLISFLLPQSPRYFLSKGKYV